MGIFLIILSYLVTKLVLFPTKKLLINNGAVRKNFLGKNIPIAMGLVIWLGITPSLLLSEAYLDFILLLTITLFVGFIDDLLGNHKIKGLRGHISFLLKNKELTSGALKAIVISIISLFFTSKVSLDFPSWIINFLILILTTNSLNLLDLRPGRAIKFFIFISLIIIMMYSNSRLFLGIMLASTIAYLPFDLQGKTMLGDAGANLLGMGLGIMLITNLNMGSKYGILLFLIVLHIYTEKRSLSVLFEEFRVLRFLDNLGRR